MKATCTGGNTAPHPPPFRISTGVQKPAPPQGMVPAGRYYGVTVWLNRELPRLAWI